jgi:hypothetical protein
VTVPADQRIGEASVPALTSLACPAREDGDRPSSALPDGWNACPASGDTASGACRRAAGGRPRSGRRFVEYGRIAKTMLLLSIMAPDLGHATTHEQILESPSCLRG